MMNKPRARFAPSPTGHLHLGNLRTALFNELFIRHEGGKLILRIEDTDVERSRPEFAEAILHDLELMGIHFDEGPFYQSKRLHYYEEGLRKLEAGGLVYPCYCTQEELKARRYEALREKRPPRYDNRCRTLSKSEMDRRKSEGVRPTIRFKVDEAGPIIVEDLIRGAISFQPDEIGDFVIMRSHPKEDGKWLPTFHLSVCVDDGLMRVTHVIRGEDHLSNSPRHVLLFRALGFPVPQFAHLSLIHGPHGEPLSKRYGALSISDFVERDGYLPEALRNYLALLGWSPKDNREVFSPEELTESFEIKNAMRHPAVFTEEKLQWINSEHLKRLPESNYLERALKFVQKTGIPIRDRDTMAGVLLQLKKDIHRFDELRTIFSFLVSDEAHAGRLKQKLDVHGEIFELLTQGKNVLKAACLVLDRRQPEDANSFDGFFQALTNEVNERGKKLYQPIRLALTAEVHGMELKRIFELLERSSIEKRVEQALQLLL